MYNHFMKLVVQIPAYNEQDNIRAVIEGISKKINNVDEIKIIVLNDASNDNTAEIAKELGVEVVSFKKRMGLSAVFKYGIEMALSCNADILVNIDADNQYLSSDIEKLIQPVLNNEADITIGTRPIDTNQNFSFLKKIFQKLGSKITRLISRTDVKDAPSGFRALNRKALLNINIFNPFTYTIEMLIQAHIKNLIIKNVDINVNVQKNRKSKLFKNDFDYICKQTKNLFRFFVIYRPARFFSMFGFVFFLFALILGLRFLYYSSGHIQSLILCAIVSVLSFICFMLALLGDLLSINRRMLEEIRYELKSEKYKK